MLYSPYLSLHLPIYSSTRPTPRPSSHLPTSLPLMPISRSQGSSIFVRDFKAEVRALRFELSSAMKNSSPAELHAVACTFELPGKRPNHDYELPRLNFRKILGGNY